MVVVNGEETFKSCVVRVGRTSELPTSAFVVGLDGFGRGLAITRPWKSGISRRRRGWRLVCRGFPSFDGLEGGRQYWAVGMSS